MRALALVLSLLAGCYVPHRYVIDAVDLEGVRSKPPRETDTIAATRLKDGKPVRVLASTLLFDTTEPQATTPPTVKIKSRARSQMLLAGHLLTWIGSAISITGTVLFLATSAGDLHTTGLIMAPSAEPLMITGTVLWVLSLIRHPQEVP